MKKYLYPANLLLPKNDFEKWAVIACDQYTSDKEYWKDAKEIVGDAPSTLNMVLPEIYLAETDERIASINSTMKEYLEEEVFEEFKSSYVYIERDITGGGVRKGILGLIDLEEYEYTASGTALTRATEQTVAERIPPRVKIRKDAPLEFPHVLLFIDDPEDSVMKVGFENKENLEKLYDFSLMKNGGGIKGYRLTEEYENIINEKLGALVKDRLLFAVGDGNHSLATAKECYNLCPNEKNRYALVEVVNIHNPAIEFEPIYRVLFGVDKNDVVSYLKQRNADKNTKSIHEFTVVDKNGDEKLQLSAISKLPVGTLQTYLDDYIKENKQVEIDYIHGTDAVYKLCETENAVGFIFDGMRKDELFDAVILDGSLPRKTFSMGHADDKRFYIEGRRIK